MSDAGSGKSVFRRRRANAVGGRSIFHKVGVTYEEEGVLVRLAAAQDVSVPRLLVESAIASERGETSSERRAAMRELFGLHRLLAALSNNVNQIARAANATGDVPPELRPVLGKVRATAERIDEVLDVLGARS